MYSWLILANETKASESAPGGSKSKTDKAKGSSKGKPNKKDGDKKSPQHRRKEPPMEVLYTAKDPRYPTYCIIDGLYFPIDVEEVSLRFTLNYRFVQSYTLLVLSLAEFP